MKNECSVVRDMLPLYIENMVSEETGDLIKEHLKRCPACSAEFEAMRAGTKAAEAGGDPHSKLDAELVKSMKAVRKRFYKRGYLVAVLTVAAILFILAGGYFAAHWFTTVDGEDMDGIARRATAYLQSDEPMYIQEVERRGDLLAALCSTADGKMAMCVFDKDPVFENRWKSNGGRFSLTAGEIGSWNYGSPDGEAVLIFCGGEIPEDVHWYTFTNHGITYTCPVEEQRVLDIFILQDPDDINGHPIPLDKEKQEIK